MRMSWKVSLGFVFVVLFAAPAFAVPESFSTYYNDYFITEVGADVYYEACDPSAYYRWLWGTTGTYRKTINEWCSSGTQRTYCYQWVSGAWQNIACPVRTTDPASSGTRPKSTSC
jgi:hypothetical protein